MYVVMNELHIPKEGKEKMIERFGMSAENMKKVPGCIEFMYLSNEKESGKEVVFTKWETKDDYEAWVNSQSFKKAHKENREKSEKANTATGNELNAYEVIHRT